MDAIRYLNSAQFTANFQSLFGVERKIHSQPKEFDEEFENGTVTNCIERKKRDSNVLNDHYRGTQSADYDQYRINNRFIYYVFKFGCALGQEEFYVSFFPFFFWNLDGPTGISRKVVLLWALSMYVGQFLKEFLRWPRPSSPPVVHLEKIYLSEYGMPSTHAIVAACIPISVVYFEHQLCKLPLLHCCCLVTAYVSLVCASRLYVGVHSLMDVLGGLAISFTMILVYVPFADAFDHWMMSSFAGPTLVISLCIVASVIYPSEGWSSVWSDTVAILAVLSGVVFGNWLGFHTGVWTWRRECLLEVPDFQEVIFSLLRTILGLGVVVFTRFCVKHACYACAAAFGAMTIIELKEKPLISVALPTCFMTYFTVAFNVCFVAPKIFEWLHLARL